MRKMRLTVLEVILSAVIILGLIGGLFIIGGTGRNQRVELDAIPNTLPEGSTILYEITDIGVIVSRIKLYDFYWYVLTREGSKGMYIIGKREVD